MLTKEEREAIAERLKDINVLDRYGIYRVVTGKSAVCCSPHNISFNDIQRAILDLCDTSNMMELPVDKDGEVIRLDDTVYTEDGKEHIVIEFEVYKGRTDVVVSAGTNPYSVTEYAHNLTHKQPVTIKSLAQRIKHVLEDEATSIGVNPYVELGRIAEQLESLGDSND